MGLCNLGDTIFLFISISMVAYALDQRNRRRSYMAEMHVCRLKCMNIFFLKFGLVHIIPLMWSEVALLGVGYGNIGSDLMRLLASAGHCKRKLYIRGSKRNTGNRTPRKEYLPPKTQKTSSTFNTVQSTCREQCFYVHGPLSVSPNDFPQRVVSI